MANLVLQPTVVADWQALVNEAERACDRRLDDELQSYLVFLLMRHTAGVDLANAVLALDYLHGMLDANRRQADKLREVGDKCLLFSGLFPGRARARRVGVDYYVGLGRSAYGQAAALTDGGASAAMFQRLAQRFVPLMDVLLAIRRLDGSQALQDTLTAMELWQRTGSREAAKQAAEDLPDGLVPEFDLSLKH